MYSLLIGQFTRSKNYDLEEITYIQQARLDRLGLLACGEHSAWFCLIASNGSEGGVSVEEIQLAKI